MKSIKPSELKKLKDSQDIHIIDVREVHEYEQGHIPGAPLSKLSEGLSTLEKNEEYYVVCAAGGRSMRACKMMEADGYQVTNVPGGMKAWNGVVV